MICLKLQEMIEELVSGFRDRVQELIDEDKERACPLPRFCFAYYDAQLLRESRYSFYARVGTEKWGLTHSIEVLISRK